MAPSSYPRTFGEMRLAPTPGADERRAPASRIPRLAPGETKGDKWSAPRVRTYRVSERARAVAALRLAPFDSDSHPEIGTVRPSPAFRARGAGANPWIPA